MFLCLFLCQIDMNLDVRLIQVNERLVKHKLMVAVVDWVQSCAGNMQVGFINKLKLQENKVSKCTRIVLTFGLFLLTSYFLTCSACQGEQKEYKHNMIIYNTVRDGRMIQKKHVVNDSARMQLR